MIEQKSIYKSIGQWRAHSPRSYKAAEMYGLIPKICQRFGWDKPVKWLNREVWTKEKVFEEALKYTIKKDFTKYGRGAPHAAFKNGWHADCCKHMINTQKNYKEKGFYDIKENVLAAAKKFNNRSKWFQEDAGSYRGAKRNGWLKECLVHMTKLSRHYTKKMCFEIAKTCKTRTEFKEKSTLGYIAAIKNGWIDECCLHMTNGHPKSHWTKENCLIAGRNCKTRGEFRIKHRTASFVAKDNGWYEECCSHMRRLSESLCTKENCFEIAKSCQNRSEFNKKYKLVARIVKENGWYEEFFSDVKPHYNRNNDTKI